MKTGAHRVDNLPIPQWLVSLAFVLLAAVGGLLGHAMRNHDAGKPIKFWRMLIEGASSGFVGFIMLLICDQMNLPIQWTGAIVGLFGWLGATASIQIIERFVFKKLGIGDYK